MVVSTAQTSDQHKGLKLFFWESNCLQHMPVFRVVAPQPDHFNKGACCKEKLLSFIQKAFKMHMCFTLSSNWFHVKPWYEIGFGFCLAEVTQHLRFTYVIVLKLHSK